MVNLTWSVRLLLSFCVLGDFWCLCSCVAEELVEGGRECDRAAALCSGGFAGEHGVRANHVPGRMPKCIN